MWTKFDIEWKFLTRLSASLPAAPDLQHEVAETEARSDGAGRGR
jgi:hypothetical protein